MVDDFDESPWTDSLVADAAASELCGFGGVLVKPRLGLKGFSTSNGSMIVPLVIGEV